MFLTFHFMSFLHSTSHDCYTPLHTLLTLQFTCFTTESNQQLSLFACTNVSPSNRKYSHTLRQSRKCLIQSNTVVTNCWITKHSRRFTVESFRFPSYISVGNTRFAITAVCAGDASDVNRGNIFKKVLRVVTPCSLVEIHWCFRGNYCLLPRRWSDHFEEVTVLCTQLCGA